jgi:ABC-type branched-subunit amino acid transport system ATPase component
MALLDISHLSVHFGGLTAVRDLSLRVEAGEIVSLIGPNGAGKTTVFNAVTGLHPPDAGRISLDGRDLRRSPTRATLAAWTAIALATGLAATVAVNAEALWKTSVTDLYRYRESFPWMQSLRHLFAALAPTTWTLVPFLLGTVLGALACWSLWRRSRHSPEQVVRAGLARTFQNIRLLRDLSVLDNVLVGLDSHLTSRPWDAALTTPRHRRERRMAEAEARRLLALVGLDDDLAARAASLPYGHQRRLEIARALATRPKLLLLDEPAAGMNATESQDLVELIRRIRDTGVTVLLIEHDMRVVMGISDRVVVIHHGELLAEGSPAAVRADTRVVEAYLGREDAG